MATRSKLEMLKLRRKMRKMLIDCVPPVKIRSTLRLGKTTYEQLYKKICEDLRKEECVDAGLAVRKRVAQLENAAVLAMEAFRASQAMEIIKTTKFSMVKCSRCSGKGENSNGDECGKCLGTGETRKEVTTERKIPLRSGEPAFLREYRSNIETAAKLEGLGATQKVEHTVQGRIAHDHQARISDDNTLKNATDEQLLEIMKLEDQKQKVLADMEANQDKIIDVEVVE